MNGTRVPDGHTASNEVPCATNREAVTSGPALISIPTIYCANLGAQKLK